MEDNLYEKINESHAGWIEHNDSERKTHYYIKEEGDWYISICGEIISERDLCNRFEENYECKDSIENYCKRCINKYKRLQNGEQISIRLKSTLV